MRVRAPRERMLFRTYKPPFRSSTYAVGQVVQHEDRLYRITRWVELEAVALERGGSVVQWEVWGRRVSARQIRREVISAAEAILGSSEDEEH